jgi:hypothetical protein
LLVVGTVALGTNKITVAAGAGGVPGAGYPGGNGAVGRIAVHHSGTISGSSTPALTDVTDTSLVENLGGSFLFNMI